MQRWSLWALLGLGAFLGTAAAAEKADKPDLWGRMERYHVEYKVNADGTNLRTYETAWTVLKEQAVEGARSRSLSHSTSVEALEVLEAYTRKKDGKKLEVPKNNYQLNVNSGHRGNSPAFSDRTTLTVVFPEVAVGDTLVLRYRIEQKEPIFPGHFSWRESFARSFAYDDVRVRVDAPASLKTRYAGYEMKQKVSEKGGRRIVEWTWKNRDPLKSRRRDWSVHDVDREPGYVFSTFDSYEQIAQAYGERARPKAEPTDRVRKLANEIVGKRKEPREQVRALYDWVATKIDYAGNCIGVGVVVPRDLDFVLDNKMGDCKDHATLLQALLAAKGIASTQALINAGNVYRLPAVPTLSTINHVINYVPSLDLFLDSTSDSTPLGMLPMAVQDKPVLLVDGMREGLKTPATAVGTNREHVKSVIEVAADFSARISVDIAQEGLFAAGTRDWMRNFPKDAEADFVKDMLEGGGKIGSGTLRKDDPAELLDRYKYGVKMEVKDFLQPGPGAFAVGPLMGTAAPVHGFIAGALITDEEPHETACTNGASTEEYVYRFPKDLQILSVPDNLELSNDFLTYRASYTLKGNELSVVRSIDDRTRGNVCAPEVAVAYRDFARKVLPNLKAQVLYK